MMRTPLIRWIALAGVLGFGVCLAQTPSRAPQSAAVESQVPAADSSAGRLAEAARQADQALQPQPEAAEAAPAQQISLLDLYVRGGPLMIPITFMSLLVVAFGLERWIGLRRRRTLPGRLLKGLVAAAESPGELDVPALERLCAEWPSSAANVVRALLVQRGRPRAELEETLTKISEREADKLYKNVRWLDLSASITPLMGLLGTVQGMIMAFFFTAHLPPGQNRTLQLAEGIYVALVTTFGGLTVAIPAAILSPLFEGRIQKIFGQLEEVVEDLLPKWERWEESGTRGGGTRGAPLPLARDGAASAAGGQAPAVARTTDSPS